MRTIAVANQKGGSGETTTAVNVAAALADQGLGVHELDDRILDVFHDDLRLDALAVATSWANLWLVPASPNLRDLAITEAVDVHHALRPGTSQER